VIKIKRQNYWLKYNYWDRPPKDLEKRFLELNLESIEDLIILLASQVSRTSEYWGKNPNFSDGNEDNYPSTVSNIWEWMKTGEGLEPYERAEGKLGIYHGTLETTEKVPTQCMHVGAFVGSGLKARGIPVRYRNILIERSGDWGKGYGPHWVIEYWNEDDEEWVIKDPKKLERGLEIKPHRYGYQMVDDLREGRIDPETVFNFYRDRIGEEFVAKVLINDLIGLSGESITPWEVNITYRGLEFDESFERYGYDNIVQELYEATKNPEPQELRRIREEGIVGYEMR
jgi:hypothetical protein